MDSYAKIHLFYIPVGFWLILGIECFSGGSNHILSVQTGGSVTIPCYYHSNYTQHKKYWYSDIDQSKIYTNTTEKNLSVIDHPAQSLFTVTMRDLQNNHNGGYLCVVETDGQPPTTIITYEPHLKVKPVPDLSVVNSSVIGDKGGDISVQCLYSSGNKNKHKQWCRYKDQSCYTVGRTNTSQNSSVQIRDGRESFTVMMTGLMKSDSGWYWCSVGNLQIPVQLTVTEAKPVTGNTDNQSASGDDAALNISTPNNEILLVCLPIVALLLLLLLMMAGVFTWRWRRRSNKNQIEEKKSTRTTDTVSSTPEDILIYSIINDEHIAASSSQHPNTEAMYSTVADTSQSKTQSTDGGTVYSTVEPH